HRAVRLRLLYAPCFFVILCIPGRNSTQLGVPIALFRAERIGLNSPSKKSIEFPELPKINRPKRKESEDGFTSPTYRQTFKKANLEIKNFTVDTSNKFKNLSQNNASDTTGNSQPIATQNMPNTSNNTTAKTTPNTLPPPVFLNIDKNYLEQLKTLTKTIPTLRSKKTGELIRLYTNNFEDYRLLNNTLEKLKFQYFCIKPKQERPIKVVIKGLPRDTETQHIHENLIELGYTVDKVTQLIGRITKQALPIFLITLPRNITNLQIFHLTQLCYLTVRVEGYDGKGVTQCYSCNKFHHTADNCHFIPRCLKCGEAHQTRDCAIKHVENTYCINCHVYGHMANYSKCPLYPKPRKSTNITPNTYSTAVDSLIRPNVSYAQAANNTSKNTQQMATLTKKTPVVSQPKQINQVVTPAIPTPAPEDNSPQALILKTLQATIQSLTLLTQQVAALSFPTPPPQPKKNKSKLTKAQLQALLEAYLDNGDE
ncbi:PRE_C2HC domain-containing protein, partial [Trichonephila inaurata madagascariensis]